MGNTLPHTRTTADLWPKIKLLARELRTDLTPAENALWQRLRGKQMHGLRFRRQHPVDRFIVDFYCPSARLVVEVDGPIHDQQQEYDQLRQAFIESLGLRVLRFTNDEVLGDMEAVLERIEAGVKAPHPQPLPAAQGGGTEPDWPEVDVIVSNPPFLGGSLLRGELGSDYYEQLTRVYNGRVPGFADLVCYWFEKARSQIEQGKAQRAGLLATNSIRGGANREVLKRIKDSGDIFMAWSDRAWVLAGAAVRVSMVGFDDGSQQERMLDGLPADNINPDLSATVDITQAKHLQENENISFSGTKKGGDFDIPESLAMKLISLPNQSGRSNSDVVKRWVNGTALVGNPTGNTWIIDFGTIRDEQIAKFYETPYLYVKEHVYPVRSENRRAVRARYWWLHSEVASGMRESIKGLSRCIATPRVAKYRSFVWIPSTTLPDDGVYIFARDDDYFFGVLHSRLHEVWSLRMGTWLGVGNDPRYTPTTTFETFPFPVPPGQEDTTSAAYQAISAAAKQLHEEREAWLNPHPASQGGEQETRFIRPTGQGGEKQGRDRYKDRTLTNLYNGLNAWRGIEKMKIKPDAADFAPRLDELHQALDRAVCDAYGWTDMGGEGYAFNLYTPAGEEEILRRLLALNLERAAGHTK